MDNLYAAARACAAPSLEVAHAPAMMKDEIRMRNCVRVRLFCAGASLDDDPYFDAEGRARTSGSVIIDLWCSCLAGMQWWKGICMPWWIECRNRRRG
jgi:hypothetical protein